MHTERDGRWRCYTGESNSPAVEVNGSDGDLKWANVGPSGPLRSAATAARAASACARSPALRSGFPACISASCSPCHGQRASSLLTPLCSVLRQWHSRPSCARVGAFFHCLFVVRRGAAWSASVVPERCGSDALQRCTARRRATETHAARRDIPDWDESTDLASSVKKSVVTRRRWFV